MKALILSAGKGTRVRPFTFEVPKPIMPVLNKPVMEILIERIRLPLIGRIITNASAPRKMAMGKWRFSALTCYTNAGIGFSMAPVRYNCPPEIAIIELRKGSEI